MRAAETLALADEMKEAEPKAIMLRIVADYEKLADWAEKKLSALVGQETGELGPVGSRPTWRSWRSWCAIVHDGEDFPVPSYQRAKANCKLSFCELREGKAWPANTC